jgi:hypothetical protein
MTGHLSSFVNLPILAAAVFALSSTPQPARAQAACIVECEEYVAELYPCEYACASSSNPSACLAACNEAAQQAFEYCYEECEGIA